MNLTVGFGTGVQSVDIPKEHLLDVLLPNSIPQGLRGQEAVSAALKHPIGTRPLTELVHPEEKIAIVTTGITRPIPTYAVMPALLDELYAAGVRREDITLVFALGSHRNHTPEEQAHLAGPRAWQEITCAGSDPSDCVRVGVTSRGTPVDIDRRVAEANRRICLGNIEYHYFAGYEAALRKCGKAAAVIAMPYSGSTLPSCEGR